jgi:hypothetical protein
MRINPALSNITRTPAWPTLFWNLCHARADALPGPARANTSTAAPLPVTLPRETSTITISHNHNSRQIRTATDTFRFIPTTPGIYTIKTGNLSYAISANFTAPDESDLSSATTISLGSWNTPSIIQHDYTSIAWIAALTALLALTIHTTILATRKHSFTDGELS